MVEWTFSPVDDEVFHPHFQTVRAIGGVIVDEPILVVKIAEILVELHVFKLQIGLESMYNPHPARRSFKTTVVVVHIIDSDQDYIRKPERLETHSIGSMKAVISACRAENPWSLSRVRRG